MRKLTTLTAIALLLFPYGADARRPIKPAPPPPTPTPVPAPTGGYVPSPSLAGAADLVAPFAVNLGLKASWGTGAIPGLYGAGIGAFRFTCGGEGQVLYDDPLLYPGQPGASHLHKFSGPKGANAFTTVEGLALLGETNCNYGPNVLNHSLYWMPAALTDTGSVLNPDWEAFYYKRAMASAPKCHPESNPQAIGICVPLPNQIRFIFGWDPTNPNASTVGVSWYCTSGSGGHYKDIDAVFQSGCAAGATLVADMMAPDCWDGKYLDTPNHRDHVAYGSYGTWGYYRCPATHPYVIPQMETKKAWTVTADMYQVVNGVIVSRIKLASDHMKAGAKPGETMHADYIERWVAAAKKMWTDGCIDKGLDCTGGDLGNGLQLLGASQPAYGWTNPNRLTPIP